uniref:Cilia- and flagella-associated protein 45 n=1 Tax=Timema shepardi TaxID=629360 RepID=A0A7R9ARY8_TIMSH|nr:unnamed protein product [Timema shepardi]
MTGRLRFDSQSGVLRVVFHFPSTQMQECRMINEAQMAMQLDDLKNQKKRVEEQQKMREELRKVNEQLLYFQDLEREEERIADLRVQEYMKQKAKREAAREEELKLQKMAKEREIARLRALQQRQQDLQAEMDELNAQRIQDEVEREWRKKEREAAKKKAEEDIAMKKARELQIQDRRRMQALEIAREKKEFESVLKVQIESAEKSKLENLKKKNETEAYRSAILKQINEKERERIKCRQELFEEGLVKKREEQLREKHMREIMNKKIDELSANYDGAKMCTGGNTFNEVSTTYTPEDPTVGLNPPVLLEERPRALLGECL